MGIQPSYQPPLAKYPAVRIALLLAAGIILGKATSIAFFYWLMVAACLLIFVLAAAYVARRKLKMAYSRWSSIIFLAAIIVFGAAWQGYFDNHKTPPSARLLSSYTWEPLGFKGKVVQIAHTSTGKLRLDVVVDTTLLNNSMKWLEPYTLRLFADNETSLSPESIQLGSSIYFKATLYPLEPRSNPHEFAYKQYLASRGIHLQAGLEKVYTLSAPNNTFWSWLNLQQATLALIEQNFNPQTAALAKGLLIGYKNELSPEVEQAFSRAGLAHIMAVSGMNVAFILAPFWFVIPFFWTLRYGKQAAFMLMAFVLIFHAGLTGFSASVMRATIVGGLITYGRIFHKASDSKNLTAVAAVLLLLINPNNLYDIGFQLSFAAVYIILLILPVIQRIIPFHIQQRWYGIPIMAVIVSLIVQVGLYPILSYYFGEFSLVAPLANALVVPFLTLLVPYSLFLLPVSALLPSVGFIMNAPCRWLLELLQWFTLQAANWPWSWIETPSTGIFIFFIWLAAFSWIASLPIARLRWKMLCLLLAVLCIQQGTTLYKHSRPSPLKVVMLDVGQGDATVVRTPSGKHLLIDTGRWSPDRNSGEAIILPYLKALGINKLDAVFLSHPHADHIGGIATLIGQIPINTIYTSGIAYTSNLYRSYHHQAEKHHIALKTVQAGDIITMDPAIKILVYGPTTGRTSSNPNNHSLVVGLIYGDTRFLFMGDAERQQEHRLIDHYATLLNTDFLKVGHHGSKTSSSKSFLDIATPAIAGISVDKKNRYDHPDIQAIKRLRSTGSQLYFTSLRGALIFVSDGKEITFQEWR